jgi:hypothetical protein
MGRDPYLAHLCAQDPVLWEAGFNFAPVWVERLAPPGKADEFYQAVRRSTGTPFPATALGLGLRPVPFVEGFLLGVYGIKALEGIHDPTHP